MEEILTDMIMVDSELTDSSDHGAASSSSSPDAGRRRHDPLHNTREW